jgi:hypothetical protein
MEPLRYSLGLVLASAGLWATLSFLPCLSGEFGKMAFQLGKILCKSLSPSHSKFQCGGQNWMCEKIVD